MFASAGTVWHPAPSWMAEFQGELQKDPGPLPASSPALAILLGWILHHRCQGVTKTPYLCTPPWGPPAPSKVTWKQSAVSAIMHMMWRKMAQPDFCQFAGQQSYVFPTALGTWARRAYAGYTVLWAWLLLQDVLCRIPRSSLIVNRSSFILHHLSCLSLLITWQLLHPLAFNYPAI